MQTYVVGGVAVRRYSAAAQDGRPPLVLVHGGAHGSWAWDNYARIFNDGGWEVHLVDWLNHGDSAPLAENEFLRRGVVDVADVEIRSVANQLERDPILVGHSMGGLACLAYAERAPVHSLVLLTPVVPASVKADPIDLPVDPASPFGPPPYELAKEIFFSTMDEEPARRYHALLVAESPRAVLESTRWTVEIDLDSIDVPALVVGAEKDVLTPAVAVRRLAEIMNARYELIPGLGHADLLLKEPDWRRAADLVHSWLAR